MPDQRLQSGVFITGTDTHVGKTVATAALGMALQQTGEAIGIMKPVETGVAPNEPASDGSCLKKLFSAYRNVEVRGLYVFPPPVAPLEAARTSQQLIDVEAILDACGTFAVDRDYLLIEGAGGLLVPLTQTQDVRDLIKLLGLPCLIVSRTGLGSVNHTRLTVMGLRQAGIPILGILLNHTDTTREEQQSSTVKLIRELSDVPVLGPLPFEPCLRANTHSLRSGQAPVRPDQWEDGIIKLANHPAIREVARMVQESA